MHDALDAIARKRIPIPLFASQEETSRRSTTRLGIDHDSAFTYNVLGGYIIQEQPQRSALFA